MIRDLFFPDHSTCITCHKPITWDEYSYLHDDTGFANCGVIIDGVNLGRGILLIHEVHQAPELQGALASPIERILGYL